MKLFGTDGIRDVFGQGNMTLEMGKKFGMAMVLFCQKRNLFPRIIIGRDTRESGLALEEAVFSGIISVGGEAILAGVIPTPGLAFLVRDEKAGAGIVISASHNPFEHNGLKPFKNDGTKLTNEEEKEIENYIASSDLEKNNHFSGKKVELTDSTEKYANFILNNLPKDFKKGKFKIVIDSANGATFKTAPLIFENLSKEVKVYFNTPNGKNINLNCGSEHPEQLAEKVLEARADLGLAFDGDGDRLIAIDEKGGKLTGDQLLYIIAKLLKEKGQLQNDLVVTTVMSNLGFIRSLEKIGVKHLSTAVGDRSVFFAMQEKGAVLGGEESGHIIFSGYQFAGDGIIGGVMLLSALDYFKKTLSELASEVTLFPKILVNMEVKSKPELDTIPEICEIIKKVEDALGENGRVLVRYSGTENLCRVMVEGRDETEITQLANKIVEVIKKHLA